MPELPLKRKELTKKVGEGVTKKVYEHPKDKEKVVKIAKTTSAEFLGKNYDQEMRSEFYLTKILHLLFPNQIPDIHMVHFDSEDKTLQSINERVGTPPTIKERIRNFLSPDNKISPEEQEAIQALIQTCYDIGVHIDSMPHKLKDNYLFVEDEPVYVDSPRLFYPEKLLSVIENQLNGRERETALTYFNRLMHTS